MNTPVSTRSAVRLYRFGPYELDLEENELRKFGSHLKLEPKPLQVLIALLDRSGEVVTRSELRALLWDAGVFVDFEKGITVAVTKLRAALNDSSDSPKYIATLAGEGYRFVGQVDGVEFYPVISNDARHLSGVSTVPSPASVATESQNRRVDSEAANLEAATGAKEWEAPLIPVESSRKRRRLVIFAVILLGSVLVVPLLRTKSNQFSRIRMAQVLERMVASQNVAGAAWLFVLNEKGHSISIVNPLTNTTESTLFVSADPRGAAILPDRPIAYISLNSANRVVALNTDTHQIVASIPVGNNPVGLAANPRPPFVYVANNYSNTVSVIDSTTNKVVREVAVGSVPTEVAVNPDGTRAIVTNQSGGTVTVIDSVANAVLATIPVGTTPVGVAFTPTSKFAWITLAGQGEIAIVDMTTQRVVHRVPVGPGPVRVAIGRDGRRALASNFFSNTVTVVDTASLQSIRTIAVGINPAGIALNPAGDLAYVANYGSNTISVIDMSTMAVIGTINVGVKPVEMAVLPCFRAACY